MNWILEKLGGDRKIWMVVLVLTVFSLLAVYSSTGTLAYKFKNGNTEYFVLKHFLLGGLGLLLLYFAHLVNFKYYSKLAQVLLLVSIPLLLFTLLFGTEINDAKRWVTLPIINITFQTSDLAKLALIMYMARILSKKQDAIKDFRHGFVPVLLPPFVICGLIAPADLSTAALLFLVCVMVIFIGRVSFLHLGALIGSGLVLLTLFLTLLFALPDEMLVSRMPTWKARLENFFVEDEVPSYQTQQSKIAVATGGFFGKGPGNSTQRNFLPNPFSDFIYAIIIEEYGLLGGFIIIGIYLFLLFRSIKIVLKTPRAFGALLAVGLALMLVTQALVNMAVAVSLFPVTGLPLPLVSMGGTSLWFTSLAIGIILSVSREVEKEENTEQELEYAT